LLSLAVPHFSLVFLSLDLGAEVQNLLLSFLLASFGDSLHLLKVALVANSKLFFDWNFRLLLLFFFLRTFHRASPQPPPILISGNNYWLFILLLSLLALSLRSKDFISDSREEVNSLLVSVRNILLEVSPSLLHPVIPSVFRIPTQDFVDESLKTTV